MKSQHKIDPAIIAAEENLLIDYQFLIQELMVTKNFTRTELAELAGISKPRLSQILSPEANPTVKTMARLIHALGEHVAISTKKEAKFSDKLKRRAQHSGWGELASNDNYSVVHWDSTSSFALEAA